MLGPPQQILAPAGGLPAEISNYPGIGSAGGFLTQQIPGQFAIVQTEPVTQSQQILGSSQISLLVSSQDLGVTNATLFASLQIVSASGSTLLPNGLVSPVKLDAISPVPTQVDINLPVIAAELSPGDYLRVVISTTDMAYRVPTAPAIIDVALAQPTLALAFQGVTPLNVSSSLWLYLWVILGALVIAAIVLFATRRRSQMAKPNQNSQKFQ